MRRLSKRRNILKRNLIVFIGYLLLLLGSSFSLASSPYTFGGGACKIQGLWTENARTATRDLLNITSNLKNADGCGKLSQSLEAYLKQLDEALSLAGNNPEQSSRISSLQEEILAQRQYSQDPHIGEIASRAMISNINELAALSAANEDKLGSEETPRNSRLKFSSILPNIGEKVFQAGKTSVNLTEKILDALTEEQLACLSSPNMVGPLFTAIVQLSASLASSRQDFFGKDISALVNKITTLARNANFDLISRDLHRVEFQNSMSCLIDTVTEGYCSTLDAQVLFNEEMRRARPISWGWEKATTPPQAEDPIDYDKLKQSAFEGYYVLTQQLPIITSYLERIQRGIPPKNHSDANFQNKIQLNTFGYFIKERNIIAEWNETRASIANMSNPETQKASIAKGLKDLARMIVGDDVESSGINFLDRVTNQRKVMFQLMEREMPQAVAGQGGLQIRADDWLDANYSQFIGDPNDAMATISRNLDRLLTDANQAAIEYYNYWFIADQPGLMVDSLTGMTYDIPEALEGVKTYLLHFSKQDSVDSATLPAVFETIDKIDRILNQYEVLRKIGGDLMTQYGDLGKYSLEERKKILAGAVTEYKKLIEIYYDEFLILKARSSFLINRLASFVKIEYQRRLRFGDDNLKSDNDLLRQIYYATGDIVFERMRLISSKNPAEIDADLNLAQRTYLESLRSLEALIRDNFAATIAQLQLEIEGADSTTRGLFEDSIVRANHNPKANSYIRLQAWLSNLIYDGLPPFLRPESRRKWNYYASDKIYGLAKMALNPDLYPGLYALNPIRILAKPEIEGISENANGALGKTFALFCIQSLAFRDSNPFYQLCKDAVLQSPLFDAEFRSNHPDFQYTNFVDVGYSSVLKSYFSQLPEPSGRPQLYPDLHTTPLDLSMKRAKNYDARICALRQRNRNNYILYLTQGKYFKKN